MKAITRHIPNTITSLNLLCGCISIVFSAVGNYTMAVYMIFAAAIFDFFDGFAARLLKVSSPIGVQLDSLADMVTFGVAPAMMLFYTNLQYSTPTSYLTWLLAGIPFIIAVFSALRLAKFNVDTRQTESFIGLPTPANTLLIVSALLYNQTNFCEIIVNPYVIAVASIVLSLLLVAEIPMFSLKIKKPTDGTSFAKKYMLQIVFLLMSLVLIIIFKFGGLAIAMLLYILLSVGKWITTRK